MSGVLTRARLIAQERYDLEDLVVDQNATKTDAKFWTKQFLSNQNYILKGFQVTGIGLKSATVGMTNATLIHPENTFDFSWFTAEESPTDIVVPDASLQDGTKNYLELKLIEETNTPVTKAFWDPAANSGEGAEFNQEIDTVVDLAVEVVASTGGFTGDPDRLPLAIVEVDGSGNIVGILDKRDLFFRLETDFTWVSQSEPEVTLTLSSVTGTFVAGEIITFLGGATATVTVGGTTSIKAADFSSDSFAVGNTITSASANGTLDQYSEAFIGADKDIDNFKEALDATWTEIKALKGTDKWFEAAFQSLNGISEHLNSLLVQAVVDARWSWDGTNIEITDDSGTPADADVLAYLRLMGRSGDLALTRQDVNSAVIPMSEGEVLFIKLPASGDRTFSGVGAADTNFQKAAIADFEINDENYWIAYRELDRVYIRGYGELESGETIVIGDPEKETLEAAIAAETARSNQDRNTKLIEGGTWSLVDNAGTLELTISADAYAEVGGLTKDRNTIDTQTISFPNADSVAYIDLLRDAGPTALRTVTVADNDAVSITNDTFIFASRVADGILIGNSFLLKPGEYLELDAALAEINRYFGQLQITPHETDGDKVRVTGADIDKLNGSSLGQALRGLILKFDGAVIDFTTGDVFESDGATPLGINFTPFSIGLGEYSWYSLTLVPGSANADNTLSAQLLVLSGGNSAAAVDLDTAKDSTSISKAAFSTSGIALGQIIVKDDGAGNLEAITFDNIVQLGTGGGSGGGTGDANSDLGRYQDRLNSSVFTLANTNVAAIDEDTQLDGSSTATFDIPTSSFKFEDSTAQVLQSISQLDADFLQTGEDLTSIELLAIWQLANIDTGATYEVSRDGGNEWQAVTMERVDTSDLYRGFLTFADEASNAFNQEYAVANADAVRIIDDSSQQSISQKFAVANTTIYKNLLMYLNKNDANAAGKYFISIVADDAGAPSTDPSDVMFQSNAQNVSDLAVGNNVLNLSETISLTAGDYHLVIETDLEYKNTYAGNNLYNIGVRIDSSSGPTPNLRDFNGTVWSAEQTDLTLTYRLEGRELDLLVRITSSATAGDKNLSSYAVLYDLEDGVEFIGTNGDQLLSDNHLGSLTSGVDRSIAGRGIFLRRPDGTLREITINDNDEIEIFSV